MSEEVLVRRVADVNDILEVSDLLTKIYERSADHGFVVPGSTVYNPKHFRTFFFEDIVGNSNSVAFFTEHAFIWGNLIIPPYNRRVRMAVENIFVADWEEEGVGHGHKVLDVFEDWANINGASSVFITMQPAGDVRRERYMARKGYSPIETIFCKTLSQDDATGDVEEVGKIDK